MMYMHSNNESDKRINISKIANNISTMGNNSTAAGCPTVGYGNDSSCTTCA